MDDEDEDINIEGGDAEGEDVPAESGSEVESGGGSQSEGEGEGEDNFAPSRVPAREATPEKSDDEKARPRKSPLEEQADEAGSESQDITSALRATREQDRRKGKAVASQIVG